MTETKSPATRRYTDIDSSLARVSFNVLGEIDNRPAIIVIVADRQDDDTFRESVDDALKIDAVRYQGKLYFPEVRTSLGEPI